MPYLKPIPHPKCGCGKKAVVVPYNDKNAPIGGAMCRQCGNRELRKFTKEHNIREHNTHTKKV